MVMDFSDFVKGKLKFIILRSLNDKPMHGYAIMKKVEEITQGMWKPTSGSIYPTLSFLLDDGLISVKEKKEKGRMRKVYSITKQGKIFLQKKKQQIGVLHEMVIQTFKNERFASRFKDKDLAELFVVMGRIVGKDLMEFKGTMLEFVLLCKEGKITKSQLAKFKKNLHKFLKETKKINEEAK